MEDVIEVVACPVCGKEVSMADPSCPHCGAEFEPGTAEEPVVQGHGGRTAAHESALTSHNGMFDFNSTMVQMSLLGITYIFGYGSIVAGNYISNGGLLNASSEMILVVAGIITIAVSIFTALLLGRTGGAKTERLSFSMIALFLLLIPPLFLAFHW